MYTKHHTTEGLQTPEGKTGSISGGNFQGFLTQGTAIAGLDCL